ncbi:MAG: FHA domain-containing protein [Desulfobacterales bacterium]|nr:FHA domain-containing protein [Desulfobacterales bacterium]
MPKIYIMNGEDKGRSFDLEGDTVTIGRAPDVDIRLRDKSISRNHAEIIRRGNKYLVKDLKSKNGTFIDGMRITAETPYEIKEGVPIAVGKTFFSLGKAYPEDVLDLLDSIDLFKELNGEEDIVIKDRPMTAQKNMELIYKVSNVLMQSLNIKEVMEKMLNYVLELLKRVDRGVIILIDKKTGEISEVISIIKGSDKDGVNAFSRSIVDRVLREGKPVTMLDTSDEEEVNLSESMKLMKVRSVMCVPLISRSKIRGVIYVDSVNKPHGFRKEDLDLLTALSSPAAVAIENSLLNRQGRQPLMN